MELWARGLEDGIDRFEKHHVMPCRQLPEEITYVTDDVFSYMCNLAMEKCSRKAEKKKASCGGAAMRKRLLIKNFVAQMLAQDRQSREAVLSDSDQSFKKSSFTTSSSTVEQENSSDMEMDDEGDEDEEQDQLTCNSLEEDNSDTEDQHQRATENTENEFTKQLEEDEAAVASILTRTEEDRMDAFFMGANEGGHDNLQIAKKDDSTSDFSPPSSVCGVQWKTVDLVEDDFHKVPIPNTPHSDAHLFDDVASNMPMLDDNNYWRFYDIEADAKSQHNDLLTSDYINHFPDNLLDDNSDKLYIVEKSAMGDGHQLVGLVNMIPSDASSLFGNIENSDLLLGNSTTMNTHQSRMLTDLDAVEAGRLARKRPWSLTLFAADEEMPLLDTSPAAALVSPLCCGMLQMSPFGGADHSGEHVSNGAHLQPMMKRVKL